MKHLTSLLLAAAFVLPGAASASTGGQHQASCVVVGQQLNSSHELKLSDADPYAHLLPDLSRQTSELNSYSLDLKSNWPSGLSTLQFETRDNTGPNAGYSSPYLWEVGRGPSFQPAGNSFFRSQGYSPVPYPAR